MADKQAQAMERLLTKLSAIRKTLRGEERNLLDAMVLSAQPEVSAHSLSSRPTVTKASKATPRVASDVELHSLNIRRADSDQKASAAASRNLSSATGSKNLKPQGRVWPNIALEDGNYKANIL
jgi:hypothetical protein